MSIPGGHCSFEISVAARAIGHRFQRAVDSRDGVQLARFRGLDVGLTVIFGRVDSHSDGQRRG